MRALQVKQLKAVEMRKEVAHANDLSRAMKEERKLQEKEQDQAIFKYVQDKQQAEFERQEMERRIREEKEREVQKLRELQEKAADRQADIDALRAKRAVEQGEREDRVKAKLAVEKRTRLLADLEVSRQKQFHEKKVALEEQAAAERVEFFKVI